MAETFKVLAQLAPAATTETIFYTVPASTNTTISSIVVCNRSAVLVSFRIMIAVAALATDNKQYLYYDQSLDANSSFIATIGITLAATDVIRVYGSTANLSFNAFGVEVS